MLTKRKRQKKEKEKKQVEGRNMLMMYENEICLRWFRGCCLIAFRKNSFLRFRSVGKVQSSRKAKKIGGHNINMDTPLVSLSDTVDGAVDHKGRPVLRSNTGGWRSAYFIIGNTFNTTYMSTVQYPLIISYFVCAFCDRFVIYRCGSGGEVCILWYKRELDNVLDGTAGSVHSHCGRER